MTGKLVRISAISGLTAIASQVVAMLGHGCRLTNPNEDCLLQQGPFDSLEKVAIVLFSLAIIGITVALTLRTSAKAQQALTLKRALIWLLTGALLLIMIIGFYRYLNALPYNNNNSAEVWRDHIGYFIVLTVLPSLCLAAATSAVTNLVLYIRRPKG